MNGEHNICQSNTTHTTTSALLTGNFNLHTLKVPKRIIKERQSRKKLVAAVESCCKNTSATWNLTGWWFQTFLFSPDLGKWCNLAHIFLKRVETHQRVEYYLHVVWLSIWMFFFFFKRSCGAFIVWPPAVALWCFFQVQVSTNGWFAGCSTRWFGFLTFPVMKGIVI